LLCWDLTRFWRVLPRRCRAFAPLHWQHLQQQARVPGNFSFAFFATCVQKVQLDAWALQLSTCQDFDTAAANMAHGCQAPSSSLSLLCSSMSLFNFADSSSTLPTPPKLVAPLWPLRMLVTSLGSPMQQRLTVDRVEDRLRLDPVPGLPVAGPAYW
jgi:hypothetical protein